MTEPTTEELRKMARDVFGRELSAAEAEFYRTRLPRLARSKTLLREWSARLAGTEPATVYRLPDPDAASHD